MIVQVGGSSRLDGLINEIISMAFFCSLINFDRTILVKRANGAKLT